ncbi:Amidohydrolase OS=Streptomyces alboniger OX=132473 GN=CP975_07865 PE=4 SV=1 [Streptomyces alboniger]
MRRLHERRYDTVRGAYDAGIPVFVGTDAGGTLPHGLVASEEVAELVTAGIPPPGRPLGDGLGRPYMADPG